MTPFDKLSCEDLLPYDPEAVEEALREDDRGWTAEDEAAYQATLTRCLNQPGGLDPDDDPF